MDKYVCEEWRSVKFVKNNISFDYTNLYEVSSNGNIRTLNYKMQKGNIKILKQQKVKGNYKTIELSNKNRNEKRHIFYVHQLVAFAFPEICGEWFEGAEVNHKDENPSNNNAYNLEWISAIENNHYGTRLKRALKSRQTNGKRNIKVLQYSLNKEYLKEWESITIAEDTLKIKHISDCCLGKRNSAGGYIWKYKKAV